jgi:hypothetical protein
VQAQRTARVRLTERFPVPGAAGDRQRLVVTGQCDVVELFEYGALVACSGEDGRLGNPGPSVLALAVAALRAQGYSDSEIGAALYCTRAAVGQRFGRKGDLYTGPAGTGVPA